MVCLSSQLSVHDDDLRSSIAVRDRTFYYMVIVFSTPPPPPTKTRCRQCESCLPFSYSFLFFLGPTVSPDKLLTKTRRGIS